MPVKINCLKEISGAYRASMIINSDVNVVVPLLRIHFDSL
jgi:hypothetical protein